MRMGSGLGSRDRDVRFCVQAVGMRYFELLGIAGALRQSRSSLQFRASST